MLPEYLFIAGYLGELLQRQRAELEPLDADRAQIDVRRSYPGSAVDDRALAQAQQRVVTSRREHLGLGIPANRVQEVFTQRGTQGSDPGRICWGGIRNQSQRRERRHSIFPVAVSGGSRGVGTLSTAARSRCAVGCKYTWLEVMNA
jgi:hypothetical protein